MRHFLALLFLAAGISWGQTTPSCTVPLAAVISSATPQAAFNNKPAVAGGQTPCASWIMDYWTNGASGVSVQLEGAPDVAGVAGSWVALTACSGSANPATGTTQGIIRVCDVYYPWIRVNPTTFTGTNQKMTYRVYGYITNQVARAGGSGTIAATTNALRGDGAGNAIAVTGTGTDCVLVNGSSAACSSTTGNAGSIVTYAPAASVTMTCPSATAGTVTVFAPGNASPASYTALAANMTISWASCTAGQDIKLAVKQAATGGPYTVSGLPSGAPQISPVASVVTTYILHAISATAVAFDNVAADSGPGVVTESAAPGTPPATYGFIWDDSTNHVFSFKNPSAVVSNTSVPQTCTNQVFTAMSAAGAYTCASVSSAMITGVAWNKLTDPTGNLALTMAANTSTWTYNATTGSADLWLVTDTTNNSGTGYLVRHDTASGSTLKPFHVGAAGGDSLVVLASGAVSVNTATEGQGMLSALSTINTTPRGISSIQISSGTESARFSGYKARGTPGSKTIVVTGDFISRWSGLAYDGSNYLECASIVMSVQGTVASTRTPGQIDFSTCTDAAPSVLTTRMTIDKAGNVGIGTAAPTTPLQVNGQVLASAYGSPTGVSTFFGGYGGNQETFLDSSGSGSIHLRPGGTERVTVLNNGNLGIGLTSPVYKLDVAASGASGTARFFDQTATTGATRVLVSLGAADSATTTVLTVAGNIASANLSVTSATITIGGHACTAGAGTFTCI